MSAAWLLTEYGLQWSARLTINVGSDHEAIASLLGPRDGAPTCQWDYGSSVVLVDDCVRPYFLLDIQIARQGIGGMGDHIVEAGHFDRGPLWLESALYVYAWSRYADSRGESLELERTRRQLRATSGWTDLARLETREAFRANYTIASELAWLAVDWLVQRAGDRSYIEYATQRGRTPLWEDAFENIFGLRPAAFYAEFAASRPEIERVVTGATQAQADAQDRDGYWVSTALFPGLNLIGWLEAPTPVGELFAAIPRAEALFVWDAPERTWRYASRSARAPSGGLDVLKPGMGVWLRLGGSGAARWERLVAPGSRATTPLQGYTDLHQGGAFVAWIESWGPPLDVLGDDLLWIQRWDSSRQRWDEPQVPASAGFAQGVHDSRAGDGFWIATARSGLWRQHRARWWPETAEPHDWIQSIDFWGDVSESEQQRLRDHAAAVAAFSLERFGSSTTPQVHAAADLASGETMRKAVWGLGGTPNCGEATTNELTVIIACYGRDAIDSGTFTHEYFHTLQSQRYRQRYDANAFEREKDQAPGWLLEGSPEWVRYTYMDSIRAGVYADVRAIGVAAAARNAETLPDARLYLQSGMHAALGFLATERLTDRFGDASILEYFTQRALHATSAQAFEATFGLTLDEFYDEFAAWRAEGFPRDAIGSADDGIGSVEPTQARLVGRAQPPTRQPT